MWILFLFYSTVLPPEVTVYKSQQECEEAAFDSQHYITYMCVGDTHD